MSERIDLTEALHRCREGARILWNNFLRLGQHFEQAPIGDADWDRVDALREIEAILFRELVLQPIGRASYRRTKAREPYPFLTLAAAGSRLPMMINRSRSESSGYWDHPVQWIEAGTAEIQFVDFFDWDDTSFRDFKYYLAYIASAKVEDLSGRFALIEAQNVRVHARRDHDSEVDAR